MLDIIIDTLLDTLKLLPFLFLTFTLLEFLEHKFNNSKIITSSKKIGPLLGSLMGIFPQCGFSASATNLYATRVISIGTLISVYLATSDEMLPIMLANKVSLSIIGKILLLKFVIGMLGGFLVDLALKRKDTVNIDALCKHEKCHCEHNLFLSSLKHTINIGVFVLIFTFIINMIFEYLGNHFLSNLFMSGTIFSHLLSSLVGLIPNCGSSIMITELYLNNTITFGACMSGLLTGCGVGLLILFKTNDFKDNIKILSIIYLFGIVSGIIIDMFNFI